MRRFAYADPPYLGQAKKRYGDDTYDDLVAHIDLIARLEADYDAWALSLHSVSLRAILPECPQDVRVAAWVKPFAVFKKGVDPAYTWEPVIFKSLRKWDSEVATVRDHLSCNIALRKGLPGAKPEPFALWLFELLGMKSQDSFDDIFPGTGGVGAQWERWKNRLL